LLQYFVLAPTLFDYFVTFYVSKKYKLKIVRNIEMYTPRLYVVTITGLK